MSEQGQGQWLKFLIFCAVFVGIILASVVFGGYSSLYRSEGRIEITKDLFLSSCKNRLELLPQISKYLQEREQKELLAKLEQAGRDAGVVLNHAVSKKAPLDKKLTLAIEVSQSALTNELVKIFLKLDQPQNKQNIESFKTIKQQFYSAQDLVAFERIRYNTEIRYFNTRTKIFPGYIIVKIFGFDKSEYFELSEDSFVGALGTFEGKA